MEKLKISEVAPYLPYGLKLNIICKPAFKNRDNIVTVETWNISDVQQPFQKRYSVLSVKPILRPLSDLIKEIEVDGEKFVPIEKLFELNHPTHKAKEYYYTVVPNWVECSHVSTAIQFRFYLNDYFGNNYTTVSQLIKWHFDVFGLIEKGLAININTLNDEK
ncbi:MAG: hypothetical protein KBC56_04925 [Flavobacterium sp.]|nr:hypothetical protein [Flavobacterium sp.]